MELDVKSGGPYFAEEGDATKVVTVTNGNKVEGPDDILHISKQLRGEFPDSIIAVEAGSVDWQAGDGSETLQGNLRQLGLHFHSSYDAWVIGRGSAVCTFCVKSLKAAIPSLLSLFSNLIKRFEVSPIADFPMPGFDGEDDPRLYFRSYSNQSLLQHLNQVKIGLLQIRSGKLTDHLSVQGMLQYAASVLDRLPIDENIRFSFFYAIQKMIKPSDFLEMNPRRHPAYAIPRSMIHARSTLTRVIRRETSRECFSVLVDVEANQEWESIHPVLRERGERVQLAPYPGQQIPGFPSFVVKNEI